jgi:hypothetical protein
MLMFYAPKFYDYGCCRLVETFIFLPARSAAEREKRHQSAMPTYLIWKEKALDIQTVVDYLKCFFGAAKPKVITNPQ